MYELVFKYRPKLDDGDGFDVSREETFRKKVGKSKDDVVTEGDALKVIVSQMARRDIWVVDVEVFEFVKKAVPFRFNKNGFSLGGKKYALSDMGSFESEASVDHESIPVATAVQATQQDGNTPMATPVHQHQPGSPRVGGKGSVPSTVGVMPIRTEMFDPDPQQQATLRGMRLTPGKRYVIFIEEPGNQHRTTKYIIRDDSGHDIRIGAEYFNSVGPGLVGGDDTFQRGSSQVKLSYEDSYLPDSSSGPLYGMEGLENYNIGSQGRQNPGRPQGRQAPARQRQMPEIVSEGDEDLDAIIPDIETIPSVRGAQPRGKVRLDEGDW